MQGSRSMTPWRAQGTRRNFITGAATLEVVEQVIEITLGDYNIYLPLISEAVGRIYTFHANSGSGSVVVSCSADEPNDMSIAFDTALVEVIGINAVDEWLVLYSNGYMWFVLAENT